MAGLLWSLCEGFGLCCFLLLVLFLCLFVYNLLLAQKYAAGDAALVMSEARSNPQLPAKLRGVFWMAGNTYPELLLSWEAGSYDPDSRMLTMVFGAPYSWSFNTNLAGRVEYFFVMLSWTFFGAGVLSARFNEPFTFATMHLLVFGKEVGKWYMEQSESDAEGSTWTRGGYNAAGEKEPAYTFFKILDHDGGKLPPFYEMVNSTKNAVPVEDIPDIVYMTKAAPSAALPKTATQLVVGSPGLLSALVGLALLFFYLAVCAECIKYSGFYKDSGMYED